MKLSKNAKKQIATIEKAFSGIKATVKIYQKNGIKLFDKFDWTNTKCGRDYNTGIRKVNGFVIEGNSIADTIMTNINDLVATRQRFKYMTYYEICNRKLSQDDVKKICHYLTDIHAKYSRVLSTVKEIQFNAMREAMEIINNDILTCTLKYECWVSIGQSQIYGNPHVNMAWYHKGNYICSTYPIPNDLLADKTPDVEPEDEKKSFSIADDKKE